VITIFQLQASANKRLAKILGSILASVDHPAGAHILLADETDKTDTYLGKHLYKY
jgi:hypothetical protein